MSTTTFKYYWYNFLTRRRNPKKNQITLQRQRIYIMPSYYGLLFVLTLTVMLIGSMNYNNSMGYMLTFLLASMAMVSILHTYRMLLHLKIQGGKTHPIFVGENAYFPIWLDNRGHGARYALYWNKRYQQSDTPIIIDIPANERVQFNFSIRAEKRGWLALDELVVSCRFPLGLFHAWSYVHLDSQLLVYPLPTGQRTLPSSQTLTQSQMNMLHTYGQGEDFIGLRDYKMGDSPRHIDWKAVARGQGLLVKEFGGSGGTELWLKWENVTHLNHTETALSQLCLWVLVADSQDAKYGLQLPDLTIAPSSGEQHRHQCLKALALFGKTSS